MGRVCVWVVGRKIHVWGRKMILFYSDFCPHCKMLIETIRRHDRRQQVKMVCLEGLRNIGKQAPPQIHSVPALIVMQGDRKMIMFGKQVFDYLLSPGSGKLIQGQVAENPTAASASGPVAETQALDEPIAFVLGSSSSDMFSSVDHEDVAHRNDKAYNWSTLEDPIPFAPVHDGPFQEETRKKQDLPDIDTIRAHRELELNEKKTNPTVIQPPTFTRP